jgi:hypothetical protein
MSLAVERPSEQYSSGNIGPSHCASARCATLAAMASLPGDVYDRFCVVKPLLICLINKVLSIKLQD